MGSRERRMPLLVPLNADERRALEELADEWGMSMAATMRRLLRERKGDALRRRSRVGEHAEEKEPALTR